MNGVNKIAVIGAGAMAEAMIAGLLNNQVVEAERLVASHPRAERADELHERYGVTAVRDNAEAATDADVVVLSVKPQVVGQVLEELHGRIKPGALVLSIAAGVSLARIIAGLAHGAVVRSMPNTPARIGMGITVWCASPAVTPAQLEQTRIILSALGKEVFVDDEDYLDMATALSGTGPAYVFLFMEALIDAGVHMGFSRHVAEELVTQTVLGSVEFYVHQENHVSRLRNQVTSPGGTTAEALYYLERAGFRTALSRAVWAAYQRSVQLGSGKKRTLPGNGE